MATIKSYYSGNLSTSMTHVQSGKEINTEAPVDNNGTGQSFSPTDLVAAALGSCMVTIMGIVAARDNVDLSGMKWETTKIMNPQPRKIKEIVIDFHWENPIDDTIMLKKLKQAALTCPVALSLDPTIQQTINFNF
jgi:putative redox protein